MPQGVRKLYDIERSCKEGELSPDERKAMRDECSLPVLAELYDWVEKIDSKIAPRSRLHQALMYARNQRPYFEGCLVGVRSTKSSSAIVLSRHHADLPNPVSPDSMGIARPKKVCNTSAWVRGVRKAPPPASAKGGAAGRRVPAYGDAGFQGFAELGRGFFGDGFGGHSASTPRRTSARAQPSARANRSAPARAPARARTGGGARDR